MCFIIQEIIYRTGRLFKMKINATDNFFTHAKPIWAKGLEKEKNITLGLYKNIRCESGSAILKIAASGFYRVFVNGKFTYFGPARCAHGYYRVEKRRKSHCDRNGQLLCEQLLFAYAERLY